MLASEPRATVIAAALRALSVGVVHPDAGDDVSWAQLDDRLALLADDLAVAFDDRPKVCRECGAPCTRPPLATLAALLRPTAPPAPLTTETAKARRIEPVLWVLSSLLGQCKNHGLPVELIGPGRPHV
jgi:hypothetical protein